MSSLSNLQQRILAGVLGSAGIIGSVYFSKWTYGIMFLFISTMTLIEFYSLFRKSVQVFPNRLMGLMMAIFNYVVMFLYKTGMLTDIGDYKWFLLNIPMIITIFIMELYRKKDQPFTNIAVTLLGIIYITLPFVLLHIIVFESTLESLVPRVNGYHYYILMSLLFMIWANDTGAFIAGKTFGKTPLFKRISPNKSWEGAIGGLIFTIGFALLSAYVNPELSYAEWVILAIVVSVAGVYGDLFESLLKRSIKIKDSGSIIPGHGGFLDRFDSLLLISPLTLMCLEVIHFWI